MGLELSIATMGLGWWIGAGDGVVVQAGRMGKIEAATSTHRDDVVRLLAF